MDTGISGEIINDPLDAAMIIETDYTHLPPFRPHPEKGRVQAAMDRLRAAERPVILAGGLGPDNVVAAIQAVHPAGVDSKTKTDRGDGSHVKDLERVRRFGEAARNAPFARRRVAAS